MASSAQPFLVVGGGISGLYAALLLARAGRSVRVIERAPRTGGLAGCELFRGLPCDLGSHRLHPDVLEQPPFREIAASETFLSRPRRGVLLLEGRRIPYPLSAGSTLRALGAPLSLALGWGLLRERRRQAFATWDRDRSVSTDDGDAGFERFVVERVGEYAYAKFYRPYAEKVWGVPPDELSQSVAKKRIGTSSPWRLLRGGRGRARIDRFVYPERGTSTITTYLADRLARAGVTVETGRAFHAGDVNGASVLYAGDLGDLVPTRLEHRGLYLVYLALPTVRASEIETYYAPESRFWFGRVSELSNYSPALQHPGETVLCVEIPEGAWGSGIDFTARPRLDALLAQLAEAGIVAAGAGPLEVRQRFLPRVYPLYRRGWVAEWRAAMGRVAELGNVLPFGRQALFLHCNLDHCADLAAEAVAHAVAGHGMDRWLEVAERALTLRVRD